MGGGGTARQLGGMEGRAGPLNIPFSAPRREAGVRGVKGGKSAMKTAGRALPTRYGEASSARRIASVIGR